MANRLSGKARPEVSEMVMEHIVSFVVDHVVHIHVCIMVVLFVTALTSLLFLLIGVKEVAVIIAGNINQLWAVHLFRGSAEILSKWFDRCLGTTRGQLIVRVSLFNWAFLSTIYMLMLPGSWEFGVRNSVAVLAAVHIWVWGNAAADIFSLHVTRLCLDKYRSKSSSLKSMFWCLVLDIIVATFCLYFTNVVCNIAYILQNDQSFRVLFDSIGSIWGFKNITDNYVIVINNRPVFAGPAILISLITSYLPTVLCIVAASILFAAFLFKSVITYFSETDDTGELSLKLAFIGFFISSCLGIAKIAYYLHYIMSL